MKFRGRLLWIVGAVLLVLVSAFVLIQSAWLKARLFAYFRNSIQQQYGLRLETGSFDYLLSGGLRITASDLRVFDEDDLTPFLKARSISLDAPISILWSSAKRIRRIVITGPTLDLDHLPHFTNRAEPESAGPGLEIDEVIVDEGELAMLEKQFTAIHLELAVASNSIEVRSATGSYRGATLLGRGDVTLTDPIQYSLQYEVHGDAALVSDFITGLPSMAGPLTATGALNGKSAEYQVKLAFQSAALRVAGAGAFPLKGDVEYVAASQDAPLRLLLMWDSLPMDLIHRLYPATPLFSSQSRGEFHYTGGSEFWRGRGSLQATLFETAGSLPVSGRITAELANATISLNEAQLTSRSAAVDVSGTLRESAMQLNVAGSAGSLADLSPLAPGLRRLPVPAAFHGTLNGPYEGIRINGTVDSESTDASIHIDGDYAVATEQLHARFNGNANGNLPARLGSQVLDGSFQFEGTASGSTISPVIEARLTAQQIVFQNIHIGDAEAVINSDGQRLQASLQLASFAAKADGTYTWKSRQFEVDGAFDELNPTAIRSWLPERIKDLTGTVSGSFHADGNARRWKDAKGWFLFGDSSLSHAGFDIAIAGGSRLDLANRALSLDMNAQSAQGTAHLDGSISLDGAPRMNLHATADVDLSAAKRFAEGWDISGRAHADAMVTGTFDDPTVTGTADFDALNATDPDHRLQIRDGEGAIELTNNLVEANLQGNVNGAPVQASATIPLEDRPGKIQIAVHSLEAASLLPGSGVAGLFDLEAHAEGHGSDPAHWQGSATLTGAEVRLGESSITLKEPVRLELSNGTLAVQQFQLSAEGLLNLNVKGNLQLATRHVNAEVSGRGDLSLLSTFFPELQGSGPVDISLSASGPVQAPVLNGMVHIEDALLRVSGYPIVLEGIRLDAPFNKDGISVKSFSARLGGGNVEGGGEWLFHNGKPGDLNFRVVGRNVGLSYPEGLRSQVDADLKLSGAIENPVLSGKIHVLRAQYREDIDYRDRLMNTLLAQKKILDPAAGSTGRLKLDLSLDTRDFSLNNNLAKLRAGGDLQIGGTAAQPRISGQVRIRKGGQVIFESHEFVVENASITFHGTRDLNPVFDALLTTTVIEDVGDRQEYRITIPLQGSFDQLADAEPQSDPALTKMEIYSLLLTGRKGELGQTAATVFQRQLTAYLTGKLFFDFQRRIAGALGFSRFEIVLPDLISSEQDPGARLIIGREVAPGLEVQYSALLSQHSDNTWIVSYRLKNNLNLLFVDQEDGSYTGGLRHTLRFGGGRSNRPGQSSRRTPRVGHIEVTVDSVLGRESILNTLKLREGKNYDAWELEDRIQELKRALQKRGYLFPSVDVTETIRDADVDLQIAVSDHGFRAMEFVGVSVNSSARERYEEWWREGLSESTVLLQITDDLLLGLHRDGYHQAGVRTTQNESQQGVVYRFQADPGTRYLRTELTFQGNTQYTSNELIRDLSVLYDSQDEMHLDALHRFHILRDRIAALYIRRGYLDVQVKPGPLTKSPAEPGAPEILTRQVRIQEGESWKIAEVKFSGVHVPPAELLERLHLVPGSLFDSQLLSEDEIAIAEYYQERGYRNAQTAAEVHKAAGGELLLSYRLDIGAMAHVASVRITGNQKTRTGFIEKQIELKAGDVLTPGKLIATQNRVTSLQLFRRVRVEPKETEIPGMYDVEVQVVEFERYSFTYGLRYDSERDLEGEVQLQDGNLFGTGRNVSLYGRWSSLDTVYRLIFHSAPHARRGETLSLLPWRSLVSLSYEENEMPTFISKQSSVIAQRRWEVFGPLVFLGSIKYEQGRVTSKINEGPIDFDLKQQVSRLIGTAVVDLRDDPLDPHRGVFITNEIEHAPDFLKSDLVFTKNYTEFYQYLSFGPLVSASAVRFGVAGDLIGSEHFFAGGQNTIRGFELNDVGPHSRFTGNALGGEAVLILNEELRFPIYSWLGGVVFYDGGNVYPTLSDFSLSDVRNTAGFGLRLKSPYGIVRVDAGFNLDPLEDEPSYVVHFGLGQAW